MIEKLIKIQQALKAPKNQYNGFGKYSYRSCEDILEAVKPLVAEEGLLLTISDELVQMGDRYYVKATATITDGTASIQALAFAREPLTKKGMDESQVTGTASSYARKYALNGLFCIDDAKDADTEEYQATSSNTRQSKGKSTSYDPVKQWNNLIARAVNGGISQNELTQYVIQQFKVSKPSELTQEQMQQAYNYVNTKRKQGANA